MYQIGYLIDMLPHGQFWINIQIILSGPALIILGIILCTKFNQYIMNRFLGVSLILVGIYWLCILIIDVFKEAA
jgi:hypothetical protein